MFTGRPAVFPLSLCSSISLASASQSRIFNYHPHIREQLRDAHDVVFCFCGRLNITHPRFCVHCCKRLSAEGRAELQESKNWWVYAGKIGRSARDCNIVACRLTPS
ncbi:hypothetical protein EV421DRAFT_1096032 [Armillaria borealis]|uniref:Secreted protein n=1 Tax=Armillaria borealis TaxID=47425 RepID=A0AA39MKN6_9AGAR|nr:hypothetical protein EV421DRAFT_1096032 [Armillaria borealis]